VATGNDLACGIDASSGIHCWGDIVDGEGGPWRGSYVALAAGTGFVCAIRSDGSLECHGAATGVTAPPAGAYAAISAVDGSACAAPMEAGRVLCWGRATTTPAIPPGRYTSLTGGADGGCALAAEQVPVCWNVGAITSQPVVAISAFHSFACAILVFPGPISCTQAGDRQNVPPGDFGAVAVGPAHVCGIRADGTVACWGSNSDGQAAPPEGGFHQISAGPLQTCGIRADDTLACWGRSDDAGQAVVPE
jgi:hypothetical protein